MTHALIEAVCGCEFSVSHFYVHGSLLGRRHKFEFLDKSLSISLPSKATIERSNRDPASDMWMREGQLLSHRKGPKGEIIDPIYAISVVNVAVGISKGFKVPLHALRPFRGRYKAMSKGEQERVHKALDEHAAVARQAFHYWLRVVRWQARDGLIGRQVVEDLEQNWGARFRDKRTGKSLGFGVEHMTVRAGHTLTENEWKSVRRFAQSGREPPIWDELLFDGEFALRNKNHRGAIAYFAFACEVFMRAKFVAEIPSTVKQHVTEIIKRQTNIRMILERYIRRERTSISKATFSKINELFDLRNDIVHKGTTVNLADRECETFRQAVRDLIFSGL